MRPVVFFVAIALSYIGYVSSSQAKSNEIGPDSPRLKEAICSRKHSKFIREYFARVNRFRLFFGFVTFASSINIIVNYTLFNIFK